MITPRRRILRRSAAAPSDTGRRPTSERLSAWQAKLSRERQAFDRWLTRLKRACHALEKQQRRITRLERRLAAFRQS